MVYIETKFMDVISFSNSAVYTHRKEKYMNCDILWTLKTTHTVTLSCFGSRQKKNPLLPFKIFSLTEEGVKTCYWFCWLNLYQTTQRISKYNLFSIYQSKNAYYQEVRFSQSHSIWYYVLLFVW